MVHIPCIFVHFQMIVFLPSTDKVISRVVGNMKANGVAYTAIYTGLQPSRVRTVQEFEHSKRIERRCRPFVMHEAS